MCKTFTIMAHWGAKKDIASTKLLMVENFSKVGGSWPVHWQFYLSWLVVQSSQTSNVFSAKGQQSTKVF